MMTGFAFPAGAVIGSAEGEAPAKTENDRNDSRVVGYLPDWAYEAYSTTDFSALTHLDIAFCNPDANGNLTTCIPDE